MPKRRLALVKHNSAIMQRPTAWIRVLNVHYLAAHCLHRAFHYWKWS
jgi:hypothetical protein